jgi:hypothetical protein
VSVPGTRRAVYLPIPGVLTEAQTLDERIRVRAYELWQQDGSMEECADEYWQQAREMVERELREEQANPPGSH